MKYLTNIKFILSTPFKSALLDNSFVCPHICESFLQIGYCNIMGKKKKSNNSEKKIFNNSEKKIYNNSENSAKNGSFYVIETEPIIEIDSPQIMYNRLKGKYGINVKNKYPDRPISTKTRRLTSSLKLNDSKNNNPKFIGACKKEISKNDIVEKSDSSFNIDAETTTFNIPEIKTNVISNQRIGTCKKEIYSKNKKLKRASKENLMSVENPGKQETIELKKLKLSDKKERKKSKRKGGKLYFTADLENLGKINKPSRRRKNRLYKNIKKAIKSDISYKQVPPPNYLDKTSVFRRSLGEYLSLKVNEMKSNEKSENFRNKIISIPSSLKNNNCENSTIKPQPDIAITIVENYVEPVPSCSNVKHKESIIEISEPVPSCSNVMLDDSIIEISEPVPSCSNVMLDDSIIELSKPVPYCSNLIFDISTIELPDSVPSCSNFILDDSIIELLKPVPYCSNLIFDISTIELPDSVPSCSNFILDDSIIDLSEHVPSTNVKPESITEFQASHSENQPLVGEVCVYDDDIIILDECITMKSEQEVEDIVDTNVLDMELDETHENDSAIIETPTENAVYGSGGSIDYNPLNTSSMINLDYCLQLGRHEDNDKGWYDSRRPWVPTLNSNNVSCNQNVQEGFDFTVVSYNVLAQSLLELNPYLYTNCNQRYLEWEYRFNLLRYEIEFIHPCILTLQEVDELHYYSHFLPWLSYLGYNGIFKQRTGNKLDGCAIFFKIDLFDIIEYKCLEFYQKSATDKLNRDNVAIIAKLSPKNQCKPFCVSTTHLLYNPKRSDIRLLQMVLLLSEIDRITFVGEKDGVTVHCPIIITGDFNSSPDSSLLLFMKAGVLKYSELDRTSLKNIPLNDNTIGNQIIPHNLGISNYCHYSVLDKDRHMERIRGSLYSLADKRKLEDTLIELSKKGGEVSSGNSNLFSTLGTLYHRFNFKSVYSNYKVDVTTHHNDWLMVDYILYSNKLQSNEDGVGTLKLLNRMKLPTLQIANQCGHLPNGFCPSDHFILAAKFILR